MEKRWDVHLHRSVVVEWSDACTVCESISKCGQGTKKHQNGDERSIQTGLKK